MVALIARYPMLHILRNPQHVARKLKISFEMRIFLSSLQITAHGCGTYFSPQNGSFPLQ